MFFGLRVIFLYIQNGHTTCLGNFIDENRKKFSFDKKRRGFDLEFCPFFEYLLTSRARIVFSRGQKYMSRVSIRSPKVKTFQRTNSRGHTTAQSFFIEASRKKSIFPKISQKFRNFYLICLCFLARHCFQSHLKTFLEVAGGSTKVSKRLLNIRAFQRTNSRGHTTAQSFLIEANVEKRRFSQKSARNFEISI